MNWNIFCLGIILCSLSSTLFPTAAQAANSGHYQRYQQLQFQLEKDPQSTLPLIRQFQRAVINEDDTARQMAAYLHLQVCTALNSERCSAEQADLLLALPVSEQQKAALLKLTSQLYFRLQKYSSVIDRSDRWLAIGLRQLASEQQGITKPQTKQVAVQLATSAEEQAAIYTLRADSFYRLRQYLLSEQNIRRAISLLPTEQRYRFLLALVQQKKQLEEENKLLATMTALYPENPIYWERLAYTWIELQEPKLALHVFGSAYKAGRLPQRSMLFYAQLLMQHQAPARAVQILEHQSDHLQNEPSYLSLLGQGYLLSHQRKKALALFSRQIKASQQIQVSPQTQGNGDDARNLAISSQLAYSLCRWSQAVNLLTRQLSIEPANDYWRLLLAISHFELKDYANARVQLVKIADGQYQSTARHWLAQIDYLTAAEPTT